MYDRRTRSLWSQIDGVAKAGPAEGERLEKIPSQLMTWRAWKDLHPETLVLVKPPIEESPYASYHESASWVGLPWAKGGDDDRLDAKTLVLGVDLAERGAVAVPLEKLGPGGLVAGELGAAQPTEAGPTLVVVGAEDPLASTVFSRRVGDRVLSFEWSGDHLVDSQTGTTWDPQSGEATGGELSGSRLEAVPSTPIYWSTWTAFHPDTALW